MGMFDTTGKGNAASGRKESTLAKLVRMNKTLNHEEPDRVPISDFFWGSFIEKDGKMKNLYSFLLLFLAFVNFGKPIPTFGLRFQIVFMIFATLYLFLYYARIKTERIQVLILIGLLPMALKLALTFRLATHSISLFLFTPGLGLPLLAPAKSLYEILFS